MNVDSGDDLIDPTSNDSTLIGSTRYDDITRRHGDEYLGVLIGSLATLVLLLFTIAAILTWRRRQHLNGVHRRMLKCFDTVPTARPGASSLSQQTRHCAGQNTSTANGKVSSHLMTSQAK